MQAIRCLILAHTAECTVVEVASFLTAADQLTTVETDKLHGDRSFIQPITVGDGLCCIWQSVDYALTNCLFRAADGRCCDSWNGVGYIWQLLSTCSDSLLTNGQSIATVLTGTAGAGRLDSAAFGSCRGTPSAGRQAAGCRG